MKKLILIACMMLTPAAFAGGGHYHRTSGWVGPALIGGVIGYAISQPRPVYAQPVPVYVPQPQTVYVYPTTSPVIPSPGQVCELRSEMINGQVVTGNFCYFR